MTEIQTRNDYALSGDGWIVDGPCMIAKRPMTLEEYQLQGENLKSAEGFVQFWIGDWANQGKEDHGRGSMTELGEQIGWNIKQVWDYAYISRQYETSPRGEVIEQHPELKYGHFKAVRALEDRYKWLERAAMNGWTPSQLYRKVSGKEAGNPHHSISGKRSPLKRGSKNTPAKYQAAFSKTSCTTQRKKTIL